MAEATVEQLQQVLQLVKAAVRSLMERVEEAEKEANTAKERAKAAAKRVAVLEQRLCTVERQLQVLEPTGRAENVVAPLNMAAQNLTAYMRDRKQQEAALQKGKEAVLALFDTSNGSTGGAVQYAQTVLPRRLALKEPNRQKTKTDIGVSDDRSG